MNRVASFLLLIVALLAGSKGALGQTVAVAPNATPAYQVMTFSSATVAKDANLRSGPGTQYRIVGGAQAGDVVIIVGTDSEDFLWVALDSGAWISSSLLDVDSLATVTPAAITAPTSTGTPLAVTPRTTVMPTATFPPVSEDETVFIALNATFYSLFLDPLDDYTRYWNMAKDNPRVISTYSWRSNMSQLFIDVVDLVEATREEMPTGVDLPFVDTFFDFVDGVERWAIYGQSAVWSTDAGDWDVVSEAYKDMWDLYHIHADIMDSLEDRYVKATATPSLTPRVTTTPRPASTPRATATARP